MYIHLVGLAAGGVDCAVNAVMQLIPLKNSVTQQKPFPLSHTCRYLQFTMSIGSRGGNLILPLYYLCCERRLAPSMLYITQYAKNVKNDFSTACIFTDYTSVELTYRNIISTLLGATCIFLLVTTDIIIDRNLPQGGRDHFQGGGEGRIAPPLHPLPKKH